MVGDWDGNGVDEMGLDREATGLLYWRNTLTTGGVAGEIFFGDPGDRFVAGDSSMRGTPQRSFDQATQRSTFVTH